MKLLAVAVLLALLAILFIGLWVKSSPKERPLLPALIIGALTLGLASCALLRAPSGQTSTGEDVGDPGKQ